MVNLLYQLVWVRSPASETNIANKKTMNVAAKRGRSQKNNNANATSQRKTVKMTRPAPLPYAYHGLGTNYVGTQHTRQTGSDLLENIDVQSGTTFPSGSLVLAAALSPGSTTRLQRLASTFQRMRWNSITFKIAGSFSAVSGGGYIAAFVRDPDDVPPEDPKQALRWAMARGTSVDGKWYDYTRVVVPRGPDLLYTSDQGEPRLWSPGTLYIVSKGGPGEVGCLTINMEWDVTLSEASTEVKEATTTTLALPFDVCLSNGINSGAAATLMRYGNTNLDPATTDFQPVTDVMLGIQDFPDGSIFELATDCVLHGKYNTADANEVLLLTKYFMLGTFTVTAGTKGSVGSKFRTLAACARRHVGDTPPRYYVVGVGIKEDVDNANFASLICGYGVFATQGSIVRHIDPAVKLVARYINKFTPNGVERRYTGTTKLVPVEPVRSLNALPQVVVANDVNVSGEAWRL